MNPTYSIIYVHQLDSSPNLVSCAAIGIDTINNFSKQETNEKLEAKNVMR